MWKACVEMLLFQGKTSVLSHTHTHTYTLMHTGKMIFKVEESNFRETSDSPSNLAKQTDRKILPQLGMSLV